MSNPSEAGVLGVLGGMGPMATAYFYQRLVHATPATSDQAHIPVVIWGDGRVPDRTQYLLGRGPSPLPAMTRAVHGLRAAGVDAIAVPCNTAHAFVSELEAACGVRFIDMIRATTYAVTIEHPGAVRIGVLGTRGTRIARLYESAAAERGLVAFHLEQDLQSSLVDEAIRIVKWGGRTNLAERLLERATVAMKEAGADVVIAACTELPLVMSSASKVLPVIDSVQSLAHACVQEFMAGPATASRDPSVLTRPQTVR